MKFLAALVLVGLAACSHASVNSARTSSASAPQVAKVGELAPAWNEPTTRGEMLSMASLRGKPVYLNFFASWCPPCNEEAPYVNAMQEKYRARGLRVVGVDVLENSTKAATFVQEHHLVYPAIVDAGALRDAYNVNGLPVHVFIDRAGIVRQIIVGELSQAEMETGIKSIL